MANIRSSNEIISSLVDFFRLVQPDLDTKPGTVARDLFIDAPASQLALLYDQLSSISNLQSFRLVNGSDLDKLAKNFNIVRKTSTASTGTALLTFSSINANIPINKGARVIASNGYSYAINTGLVVSPSSINYYKSIASKFSDQLAVAGITDLYAVQVTVTATSPGFAGNIGTYSLTSTTVTGVSNVTNISAFSGGTDQENDTSFRNRVLSSFSGSSVGTTLGYLNTALATSGVSDSIVVEPGSTLMTRDGTVVTTNPDGTKTIVSEGTGGKVDVVILGSNLIENTETYIYRDKSNSNDPTNSKNNVVLGQILADANKTINKKRADDIANGQLPNQPVENMLQVSGSGSGSNFVEKTVDSYGIVSGNYELVKDTGVYAGTPFGFDTFKWINNNVSFKEDVIKGKLNAQDSVTFKDVLDIPKVQQNIAITNENSTVTSNRAIIQLLHFPATNVTRVFNVNTGERYIITNQNLDATGITNLTGRVQISGNTLPSPTDILQVDYNWVVTYDKYSDYDGLTNTQNTRSVTDSLDWGYSSLVKQELINFKLDSSSNFFEGTASHLVDTVNYAKKFTEIKAKVYKISSGIYTNRLAVILENLPIYTLTVDSIKLIHTNKECYNTSQANGNVTTVRVVVGIDIMYTTTIILPSDTIASENDYVSAFINSSNVFSSSTLFGNSNGAKITIPASLVDTTATNIALNVSYTASGADIYSSVTTSLPSSRSSNSYNNSINYTNFSNANVYKRENLIVKKNLSNQYYVDTSLLSSDVTLDGYNVLSVIRLSDGLELYNLDNQGSINPSNTNIQIILPGYHSPALNDRVLAIYYPTDTKRSQPFTFKNHNLVSRSALVQSDGTNLFVDLNKYTNESSITFKIIEPNTDIALVSVTDGYLVNNTSSATVSSLTANFSTITGLTRKQIRIYNSVNAGIYEIISYNTVNNTFVINKLFNNINNDNISVVRLSDGKELFDYSSSISLSSNKIILSSGTLNDKVHVNIYKYNNLKQAQSRLACNISDQVTNSGVITVTGSTQTLVQDIVFTATSSGLKQNLQEAFKKYNSLNSVSSTPSNVKLCRLLKLEKVVTASSTDYTVLQVSAVYDVKNTALNYNLFYTDMLCDYSLQNLDFTLSGSSNNLASKPAIGDKLRVSFYYLTTDDSESLSYTRNVTLYTNKKFAFINKIYVSSGFKSSSSAKLTVTSLIQPSLGSRYSVYYNYVAPKQNERITIKYNYNKLISDVTFNIEAARPINADVLVKEATELKLDLTINVVITTSMISSTTTILQNLRSQLNAALTTNALAQTIDQVTLINVAQAVSGIARARILHFNKYGVIGSVSTINAQANEYFSPNNVMINTETR